MTCESNEALKVLLVSAEVAPFAKAGGLADVAGALPKSLNALGVDIRIAMPSYRMVRDNPEYAVSDPICRFNITVCRGESRAVEIRKTKIAGVEGVHGEITVFLIGEAPTAGGSRATFDYAVNSGSIYAMEPEPYIFFAKAVVEWISRTSYEWRPDIIHSNDWHTGLIPVCAKQAARINPDLSGIVHLFTIHNLAYQGDFSYEQWHATGLDNSYYGIDGLECYGKWCFMKGGLNFADFVNTVSPTYAREIVTPEFGNGLDGLLHKLEVHGKLCGILNGIDTLVFNPETDASLPANYTAKDPSEKRTCKRALQRELGLSQDPDALIIGMVTRFAEQKGLDLIHGEANQLLEHNVQFALLGMGDPRFESFLLDLSDSRPCRVAVRLEYNAPLAQRIYAGADLFLMPSRFEPCGLGQLIALRYGTIPIVRSTGGLADTVIDYTEDPATGNGFSFKPYAGDALVDTVGRAVQTVAHPALRSMLVKRAMTQDWSWGTSAISYVSLYERLLHRGARA